MAAAAKKSEAQKASAVPFHVYLAKALDEADLNNPEVARRLGYPKANVISMMRTGMMKVPINKIPALADMIKVDRLSLLMMALAEYDPQFLEALKMSLSDGAAVSTNEKALLEVIRSVMPNGEFSLTGDDDFVMALTALVGREVEKHKQAELQPSPDAKPRDSKNALLNKEMTALLQRQARERQKLYERMVTEVGTGVLAHRKVA